MTTFTTTSPTSIGNLPEGVTEIGGVVLDMIGTNGVRVVSQLAASELFVGFFNTGSPVANQGNPGTIGTQLGFDSTVLDALGGGLSEVAVRLTIYDGDTSPSDFDDDDNTFLLNGISIGNFSDVTTEITSSDGLTLEGTTTGFSDQSLNTGWFHSTDTSFLNDFYSSLTTGEVSFQLSDFDPYDNYFDFTQGVDGSLIDVGTGPTIDLLTAQEIFDSQGKLLFMAQLAQAAYHLDTTDGHEFTSFDHNDASANGDNAYNYIQNHLHLFSDTELPSLALELDDQNDIAFPKQGIANGIYTHGNAAALVGRSDDAVFISFRGTNDNNEGHIVTGTTPDVTHWYNLDDHYALFADLNDAVLDYITDVNNDTDSENNISKVYVTGHSMGGGMTQAFMQQHLSPFYEAITFASSGYQLNNHTADSRISNFWNDLDIIDVANLGTNYLGSGLINPARI